MEKTEKTRKVTKYVPLVTFQIKEGATTKDKKEYHICDAFDDIEDAFNDGVKYRYHETRISKNDGAIVFTLFSDIACLQLLMRLESLKQKKIEFFNVFPFRSLLNDDDTEVEKLNKRLIEELINNLIEKPDEESIKKLIENSIKGRSIKNLIEKSDNDSIKRLYKNLEEEIEKLKIET